MARAKGIVLLGVIGSGEQLAWWSATSLLAKRLPAAVQLMQAVEPVLPGVLCNAFRAACAALRSAPSAQVSAHAATCSQARMGAYIEHSIAGAPWQSRFWIFTMQTCGCAGQMAEGSAQQVPTRTSGLACSHIPMLVLGLA